MASRRAVLPCLRAAPEVRVYFRPATNVRTLVTALARPSRSRLPPRPRLPALSCRPLQAAIRPYSQQSTSKPKTWSFEEVQKLTQDPASEIVLVDAREPKELQETGRIPGAVNIPITSSPDSFHIGADEFEDRFGFARPPHDAKVVFYCRSGVRSKAAAGLASAAGWANVGEYPGSWLDWAEKGGKVER